MSIAVPEIPNNIPNIFLIVICSLVKSKYVSNKVIKGIVAMHKPTKTEDKCSWATASNVKGKAFDSKATPKQEIQYPLGFRQLKTFILNKSETIDNINEPIIILNEAICVAWKEISAILIDKKELPQINPRS